MYTTGKKYLSLEMFMTWLDMILGISKPKTHILGCFQVIPVIFPYRKNVKNDTQMLRIKYMLDVK